MTEEQSDRELAEIAGEPKMLERDEKRAEQQLANKAEQTNSRGPVSAGARLAATALDR